MTAIAYRDGVMAADALVVKEFLKVPPEYSEPKIFPVTLANGSRALVGVAGEECPSNRYIAAWLSDAPLEDLPTMTGKFIALVAAGDGKLWEIDQDGDAQELPPTLPFYAIGAGAEICVGYMEAGGNAAGAVKAAIKWSSKCGGFIQVVKV